MICDFEDPVPTGPDEGAPSGLCLKSGHQLGFQTGSGHLYSLRTACVPAAEVAFPKILMPVMSRSIMTLGAD